MLLALGCAPKLRAPELPPPPREELRAAPRLLPAKPATGDLSFAATLRYQHELAVAWGGVARAIPLETKARHFAWLIERYHRAPDGRVNPRVWLPEQPGEPVRPRAGADVSTWNGALLAALAHRLAVRGTPADRAAVEASLRGLARYQQVTAVAGLIARGALPSPVPIPERRYVHRFVAPDGSVWHWRGSPAKGTYVQVVHGYATALTRVGARIDPAVATQARADLARLGLHLVRGGYELRDGAGEPIRHGDLRPRVFGFRIPFQAQVSYAIVASAAAHAPPGPLEVELRAAHAELRAGEAWWAPFWLQGPAAPQRVARRALLDQNDLTHLLSATWTALDLELRAAEREQRAPDERLLRRLGESFLHAAPRLERLRHTLGAVQWASLLADERFARALLPDPDERERERERAARMLAIGVEQLRRFPLSRLLPNGVERRGVEGPHWADAWLPDAYVWKVEPDRVWERAPGERPLLVAAIDYLHAYWLLRDTGLDAHPAVRARHASVL